MKDDKSFATKLGHVIGYVLVTAFFTGIAACLIALMVALTSGFINLIF